ncbi:acyl-CoA dehydrogenase family protein [Streptomyces sp. TRM 70351]|uniref:acyl-CoA dehydrogenase family protein n=1 Tax=Streptomyces sp. TRM 70351 TaxID=3116552 RepID=UPI002E7AB51B|nr:acyl-CoA dehydrogenase family protein [Streptomyces sp. TRM 70351]MEE1927856.1 acyl-CoA dehydrogenase family protein [Streptomyces sp. TRM 70351]
MTTTASPARRTPAAGPPFGPDRLARLTETVREHARHTDEHAEFPAQALAELRTSGLLGLLVPTGYGGAGGSLKDMLEVSATLSRTCMSVGMIFAMHCQQVAALVDHGSEALRDEVLPGIARGEVYLASVTTESGKGGHLLTSESALDAHADTLRLDRTAPVVTGGAHADAFLVTTQAPGATSPHQVSLVYAERARLEAEVTGGWNPVGMRATHSVPMRLRGDVPAHHVVGEHGAFRTITVETFAPLAHLGWSACWLGTAAGALARTVEWLRSPAQRRRRDLSGELLLTRLGRARQRLETVHALLQHAADVHSDPSRDRSAAPVQSLLNTLKLTASEECLAAVDELVELAGLGQGYLRDAPLELERAWRDLRSASLNYGNDRLRTANGTLALLDREVTLA